MKDFYITYYIKLATMTVLGTTAKTRFMADLAQEASAAGHDG